MANDVADWTSSVVIQSGSVTIAGTATVTISGTPTVAISGTPSVNIANTPAVTINAGSVTAVISGTPNVNISAQSITVEVNHPWVFVATHAVPGTGAGAFSTPAVPSDAQQLAIGFTDEFNGLLGFSVRGHQTGIWYLQTTAAAPFIVTGYIVIPINGVADSTYDIAWSTTLVNTPFTMNLYESALPPGFAALGPQPQEASIPVTISPDQAIGKAGQQPIATSAPVVLASEQHDRLFARNSATFAQTIAAGASLDLVAAVVGQRIYPLAIDVTISTAGAANIQLEDDAGFIVAVINTVNISTFARDLKAPANLSVGHKMRLHNVSGVASGGISGEVPYSQF